MSFSIEHNNVELPRATSALLSAKDVSIMKSDVDLLHGESTTKSTNVQASFTLFKVFVGSGILALPLSFVKVGFGLGILSMVFCAILTYHCMSLLLRVLADLPNTSSMNLQKLTERVLGKAGRTSVEVSLVIMQVGICIAILIFATKFLNYVVCGLEMHNYCNNNYFLGTFTALIVIPLSFISNMHYFYYPSLLATFFVFANIIMQLCFNYEQLQTLSMDDALNRMKVFNFEELPKFFGVATYAFEGIGCIFSVRASMQKPSSFISVLRTQMVLVTILYAVFPGSSQLAYGDETKEIILFNIPLTYRFLLGIQGLYVLAQLFSFPVQLYPVVNILESSKTFKKILFDKDGNTKNIFLRYGIRVVMIILMLLIAIKTKSFNNFLNLLGSGVFVYLGYLLPIVSYHTYFKKRVSKFFTVINVVAFPISLVLGVIGITISIQTIINDAE